MEFLQSHKREQHARKLIGLVPTKASQHKNSTEADELQESSLWLTLCARIRPKPIPYMESNKGERVIVYGGGH